MKTIIYLSVAVVLLTGCQATRQQVAEHKDYSDHLHKLTPVEQKALDGALAFASEVRTRGGVAPERIDPFSQIDRYELAAYNLYELDVEKFMQNPVMDNFANCISAPADRVLLAGKDPNRKYRRMEVIDIGDDDWKPSRIHEIYEKYWTWIDEIAADADPDGLMYGRDLRSSQRCRHGRRQTQFLWLERNATIRRIGAEPD